MRPARNVAFVLVWNSDGEPIELDVPGFSEMKNIFVAIVQKSLRADRLEMDVRANFSLSILNRDGFHPVNHILPDKHVSQLHDKLVRYHRARVRGAYITKERSLAFQNATDFSGPFAAPLQIRFPALIVRIFSVFNPKVIRW